MIVDIMQSKSIKQIIDDMPNVPTMPNIVAEALNIIGNPKSNINQLSGIISKDLSLTSQILKLVNSSYYGFPNQITTINKAMALLGFNQVKSLILSVALKSIMVTPSGKNLWVHSIRCAIACQNIANSLGKGHTDEAFVMGLLHDIGKTVLESYNKQAYNEIIRLTELGADKLAAEKMMFGFTHTEIGEELVLRWKLPAIIADSVRYHHQPQEAQDITNVGVVYYADSITQSQLKYPIIDPDIAELLDFDVPNPVEFREQVFKNSESIISVLS